MSFDPVKEGKLVLSQLLKDLRLLVTVAKLLSHILNNICDP